MGSIQMPLVCLVWNANQNVLFELFQYLFSLWYDVIKKDTHKSNHQKVKINLQTKLKIPGKLATLVANAE